MELSKEEKNIILASLKSEMNYIQEFVLERKDHPFRETAIINMAKVETLYKKLNKEWLEK